MREVPDFIFDGFCVLHFGYQRSLFRREGVEFLYQGLQEGFSIHFSLKLGKLKVRGQ